MNRFGKGEAERKFVRVPAGLRRKVEGVILKSQTVLAQCPFGHDAVVDITVEYVPKHGPDLRLGMQIQRKKVPPGPKMVQSDEPFTNEHFELLLREPFCQEVKRFICFFQKRGNKPMSPVQWMRKGFLERNYVGAINSLCRRHRLGISFLGTGEYDVEERVSASRLLKHKFYVLERAGRKARE